MSFDEENVKAGSPHTAPFGLPMKRSTLLRSAALAAGGAALAGGTAAAYATQSGQTGAQAELEVTKIADLSGPDITTQFRMEATDLGIPVVTPDGRTLFVFGDTFEHAEVGGGWWRSPVALYSETTDLNEGVTWSAAVGGEAAEQLWDYEHDNPEYSTVLPSDVIVIGDTMYLHVMVNKDLGNVVWTEIWQSTDSGATWEHTGAEFPPNLHDGLFQLLTWALDGDHVYIYSTEFTRSKPIIMSRVHKDEITNPDAYEVWGHDDQGWDWGKPVSPILEGEFGEMSLRPLDDKWVLTWFNEGDYCIDGIIMDSPTSDLTTAHRATLLWGTDWGEEDDAHIAQLYGGYVIPGSTLDELHLSVSQWNTQENWPYKVMQHRIRGFAP